LAIIQTEMLESALRALHPDVKLERVIIKTSGDWKPEDGEKPLSAIEGGKGLFAREIEKALLDGSIDCAVHSTKDMPSFLPEGLALDHFLPRADARDAFICRKYSSFMDLPQGAVVGTTSPRRQAFVLSKRPDLKTVTLRGNVQTRLDKLDAGQVDAAILAIAGLNRLNICGDFIHVIDEKTMLPACGQGAVGIETRVDDVETRALLDYIHHKETGLCVETERAALQVLDGSCHTPIGAHAVMQNEHMTLDLAVAYLDGREIFTEHESHAITSPVEAAEFGRALAMKLKARVPADIFA